MKTGKFQGGRLFNNAGKGHYLNKTSVRNVILYDLREGHHEDRVGDLITWGGFGVPEWVGAEGIIEAYELVQQAYVRKGTFGRYIDHEVYDFSKEEIEAIERSGVDLDQVARKMAYDFFKDGTQVVYAVHNRDNEKQDIHVHFAVNTVNYKTMRKRRENKTDTRNRSRRMNEIVQEEVRCVLGQ